MNEELLRELVELQREQNQLFRRYLWRLRFSLLSLLLLMTATAVYFGFIAANGRSNIPTPATTTAPPTLVIPTRIPGAGGPRPVPIRDVPGFRRLRLALIPS